MLLEKTNHCFLQFSHLSIRPRHPRFKIGFCRSTVKIQFRQQPRLRHVHFRQLGALNIFSSPVHICKKERSHLINILVVFPLQHTIITITGE